MCPTSLDKSGEFKYGKNTWGYCEAACQPEKSKAIETGMILFIDLVVADFFG